MRQMWGPFTRREHPGVPADHFLPACGRHAAVDHRGRITALVADGPDPGPMVFGAIPLSAGPSDTTDAAWDGGAQEKNLNNEDGKAEYRQMYAWVDSDADQDTKSAYSFPHHMVDGDGKVGAANTTACSSGIGVLNGGRGVSVKDADWFDDRAGIFKHLVAHLSASGVKDEDLPKLDDMTVVDEREALVVRLIATGKLDDAGMAELLTEDSILHDPDNARLTEYVVACETPDTTTTITRIETGEQLAEKLAELRERQGETPRIKVKLAAFDDLEVEMAIHWDPEVWDESWVNEDGTIGRKGAFVSNGPETPFAMVAAGGDLPQLVDNPGAPWHAILCVEGLRTDEDPGREIMPMACEFPDLPVSLRLQIHDEGGHWGAVTCGRIDTMERQDMQGYNAIAGAGVFGTDEHGQLAQLLVTEQTQRFISIDPRAVTVEVVEVEINTSGIYDGYDDECEPDLYDWWMRYTSLTIGAATIVATPALQQAVITLADVPLPETPIAIANAQTSTVVASAGPLAPPGAWFEDPAFHVGDPRLVRQADGHYACPLTVDDDGRVYGHAAYWGSKHTGFPGRTVHPPHSPTYAYFTTGHVKTAEGKVVPAGQVTMGCGHATTDLDQRRAVAHYDGGYGAIQMADIQAGEDDFGIWVAGSLRSDVTETDIAKFRAQNLSGDWRTVAGTLHMVACLAVPVPGFPISRESLIAAGAEVIDSHAARAGVDPEDHDVVLSLVAAGRVHRAPPEERLQRLEHQMDSMRARERRESVLADLRGLSA